MTAALELSSITVRFGGIVAVKDATIVVQPGEAVGLIGPNGAGKTTLLDVAAGARRPTVGRVSFFGDVVTRSGSVRRARLGIARTFQQLALFDGLTVREHVVLGYLASREDLKLSGYLARRQAIVASAMDDDSPLAPAMLLRKLGLDAVADQLAGEQSVGMVRMVDLARALASRPRVLLLDEPVSGLSETEAQEVGSLLRSLRQEHTISMLIVEHNLEFARLVSDRLVALDFGTVIAEGPPDDVLSSSLVRGAYFGADSDAGVLAS